MAYKKVANEGKWVGNFEIITKIKESSKEEKLQKSHKIRGNIPRTLTSDLSVGGFTPGKQPAYSDLLLRTQEPLENKLYEERSWSW